MQLDALVKQITASFVGAQSCIPEPASPATSRPTRGTPLTTPAQVTLPTGLCYHCGLAASYSLLVLVALPDMLQYREPCETLPQHC